MDKESLEERRPGKESCWINSRKGCMREFVQPHKKDLRRVVM